MAQETPRQRIRRLPAAIVVGLLAAVSLGVGLGAAFAADEPRLPETFAVPALHVGDRGVYDRSGWTQYEGWMGNQRFSGSTDFNDTQVSFEWMNPAVVYDGDGVLRDAAPLIVTTPSSMPGLPEADYIDPATGTTIASEFGFNFTTPWIGAPRPLLDLGRGESQRDTQWRYTRFAGTSPCGLWASIQGTAHVPESLRAPGCSETQVLSATGTQRINGALAIRYQGHDDNRTYTLWYGREASAPLRVHLTFDHTDEDGYWRGDVVWDLVGFEAGSNPYPPARALGEPLDAIPLVPRGETGPDAGAIVMEFPLETAWQAAREDDEVQAFRQEHPEAYVASAAPWEGVVGDYRFWQWSLVLTDGPDVLRLDVTRTKPAIVHDASPDGVVDEVSDALWPTYVSTGGNSQFDPFPVYYATREHLPARMPSPAAVGEAWAAIDAASHGGGIASDRTVNTWSFSITCDESPCTNPWVRVGAGHSQLLYEDPGPAATVTGGEARYEQLTAMLLVDGDGQWEVVMETESRAVAHNDGLLAGASDSPGKPVPSDRALVMTPWWSWPTPAAAAGAGILGVLVGIIYWIWPSIKATPAFGLFSRLHRNQVANHPSRARILQALEAEPGLHHSELRRRLAMGNGAIDHHLNVLVSNELIVRRKEAGYVCFFPTRGVDRRDAAALPWIRSAGAREILAAVASQPGQSALALAAATNLNPATVHYHLKRLREAGLVDARRQGRYLAVHPTGQGMRIAQAA